MAASPARAEQDLLNLRIADFLERLASEQLTSGSGAACGVVVSLAAALVASCARTSLGHWDGAAGALAQAEALRSRAAPMAQSGADAYLRARAMLQSVHETDPNELGDALDAAAWAPLRMAETAADVALLAADLCEHGRPEVAPDAAAAAALAHAASRAGCHLVAVNLLTRANDEYLERAKRAVAAAAAANERGFARPF
ncbi:MAG TPA: cyclodeaminase/cyclohydrolase family protein [Solirubrobacteraceae bacterium]|jgi:formiminotetrahydrofolate cyclodeaminase|nr:cyclodeaminase/cyclohydrolase family protein [Solirubrobacteraceae bacterium]